jgi:drug/metabolite transporter (DMT)-like permease
MTYLYFVLLAVFPQLIGHSSLNWALKYLPTTYVAIAQMGEPVGSTILAIVLFNEVPSPLKIIGALFIMAGIYTVSRKALSG